MTAEPAPGVARHGQATSERANQPETTERGPWLPTSPFTLDFPSAGTLSGVIAARNARLA